MSSQNYLSFSFDKLYWGIIFLSSILNSFGLRIISLESTLIPVIVNYAISAIAEVIGEYKIQGFKETLKNISAWIILVAFLLFVLFTRHGLIFTFLDIVSAFGLTAIGFASGKAKTDKLAPFELVLLLFIFSPVADKGFDRVVAVLILMAFLQIVRIFAGSDMKKLLPGVVDMNKIKEKRNFLLIIIFPVVGAFLLLLAPSLAPSIAVAYISLGRFSESH